MTGPIRLGIPAVFAKPLSAITAADLEQLVRDEIAESDTLELKERLPAKGNTDPWAENREISDRAKIDIMQAIIAFANTHGGHLILGVQESDDHPHRAIALTPLPDCADLADRIAKQARALIEPQIPLLDIAPVPEHRSGAGFVVARVGASRLAPHRHITTRECYRRHSDSSQGMSMREIQDLTLQRAATAGTIDRLFEERRSAFAKTVHSSHRKPNQQGVIGIRATAIPGNVLQIERARLARTSVYLEAYELGDGKQRRADIGIPPHGGTSRPILRGRRLIADHGSGTTTTVDQQEDGFVEYRFIEPTDGGDDYRCLFPERALVVAVNTLATAHAARVAAGAQATEYQLEVEIARGKGDHLEIVPFGSLQCRPRSHVESNPLILPRYSFGEFETLTDLAGLIASDLLNAGGLYCEPSFYRLLGPTHTLARIARSDPAGF